MSNKRKILIQLDGDDQPSVFDRVVAIDAGVDELFSYGQVKRDQVKDLIHGCIFTRGAKDLSQTAVFVGGGDVGLAEALLNEAKSHLLPQYGLSVSLMLDPNGANTTAAAAVRCAGRHLDLSQCTSLVLGGTGPVGQRVALLLARQGGIVHVGSRQQVKAAQACERIADRFPGAKIDAVGTGEEENLIPALRGVQLVVTAGAAGVCLLPASVLAQQSVSVLIDLNAVPPLGIEGVEATDAGKTRHQAIAYGAIGVGGLKMKVHKAAIAALFTANNLVLDAETIYDLAAAV
jgi:methylenetetrahydrofolate/methylenetetrahydromethanopterin dehydrogenase (NADP+)